jgi:hypothetical protein
MSYTNLKSRFCYSYKSPGIVENCCNNQIPCATNEYLSSISNTQSIVFNNSKQSDQMLLNSIQQQMQQFNYSTLVTSTLSYTSSNISTITNELYEQLLEVSTSRYLPYKPYIPMVVPPSVIELQMNTINTGVPMSFFTIADCKGSQSITTSKVILN